MRKLLLSIADLDIVSFVVPVSPETRGTAYAHEDEQTGAKDFSCGNGCLDREPEEPGGDQPSEGRDGDAGDGSPES